MATNGPSPRDAVILSGARTPHGKLLGVLTPFSAAQLGQIAVKAAVQRSGVDPADFDEVIIGQVVPAGSGQAVPRQISTAAGIPPSVGGLAINKACGSSLKSVMLAAGLIRAGDGDLYLSGGTESMSNAPFMDLKGRQGHKYGHYEMVDSVMWDGLYDHMEGMIMGLAAELIADKYEISREEMDEFSARSHALAHEATQAGRFKAEIVPVEIPGRKGQVTIIDTDEPIRPDTTVEGLAKLKPAFKDDGRVTAGNAPGLNDGAAAVVVASREYAEQHGHRADRAHRGVWAGGGRTEVAVRRADLRVPEGVGARRLDDGRCRSGRTERSLCRAGARRSQGFAAGRLRDPARQAERQRRRDRARPPDRRVGGARAGHADPRPSAARAPARAGGSVPGRRGSGRAGGGVGGVTNFRGHDCSSDKRWENEVYVGAYCNTLPT